MRTAGVLHDRRASKESSEKKQGKRASTAKYSSGAGARFSSLGEQGVGSWQGEKQKRKKRRLRQKKRSRFLRGFDDNPGPENEIAQAREDSKHSQQYKVVGSARHCTKPTPSPTPNTHTTEMFPYHSSSSSSSSRRSVLQHHTHCTVNDNQTHLKRLEITPPLPTRIPEHGMPAASTIQSA